MVDDDVWWRKVVCQMLLPVNPIAAAKVPTRLLLQWGSKPRR